ncbi:MAG TPA: hypothetical protein VH186_27165 [Chloroflexia bacterium]|nr:hypothetical protein [Chloroflexia bacterium]
MQQELSKQYELVSGKARLLLRPSQSGHKAYSLTFLAGDRPVFTDSALMEGAPGLLIEQVEEGSAGTLRLKGTTGQGQAWQGSIESLENRPGWFSLTASFPVTSDLQLEQAAEAPAVRLSLEPPPEADRAVAVCQPTEHNPAVPWLRSNDLPAAYLWQAGSQAEAVIFPDLEKCDWFQRQGLNRLADYRCGPGDSGRTFGFMPRPDSATRSATLPAGTYHLAWRIYLAPQARRPSEWTAVRRLAAICNQLLPGTPAIPAPAGAQWATFARADLQELMLPGLCWMEQAVRGYVAYVQEESQLARNGGPVDERIEAMASLDVLPAWFAALRLWPDPAQADHLTKVAASLRHHYSPEHRLFINQVNLRTGEPLVMRPNTQIGTAYGDTWYFFEPLLRLGWSAHLTSQPEVAGDLSKIFLQACERAIEFVKKHDYRLASFYNPLTLEPFHEEAPSGVEDGEIDITKGTVPFGSRRWFEWLNTSQNWACLGIYAYIMLQAYWLSGEESYQAEAEKAVDILRNFPPDTLFWEPFELSYGAAAASILGRAELATDLAADLLRMGYWQDETALPGTGARPRRGLFQAWAGIRYPAQKENGETLLALLPWLRRADPERDREVLEPVIKFFNLARYSAFQHYTSCLDEQELYPGRAGTPTPSIPLEDLEMFEWCAAMHLSSHQQMPPAGQASGAIGREIYGAGETVWFALMFEALGQASDPAIMLLNLDLFEWDSMAAFPAQPERHYIVYNPLSSACRVTLTFEHLTAEGLYLCRAGKLEEELRADGRGQASLAELELEAGEWRKVVLTARKA